MWIHLLDKCGLDPLISSYNNKKKNMGANMRSLKTVIELKKFDFLISDNAR